MEPQGFPQPYKQPNLPPSLRFPRRTEIDWIDLPLRYLTAPAYAGNGGTGTITASTTGTGAFGSNLTAGNCLVISVETVAGVALSSVTDTLGQLWTIVTNANNVSGGRLTMAYCNNCMAGACTVTVTIGSSGTASFAFAEYSGVGSIAQNRTLADANATATGNSTAPQAAATPQQSGSLLVVGAGSIVGGSTYTGSNSCTTRQTSNGTYDAAIGDKALSTTSIAAATGGFTIASAQWSCVALVLRPAGQQAIRRLASAGIASAATLTSASYTPQLGSVLLAFVQTVTTGRVTNSVSDTASASWSLVAGSRAVNASGGELSAWICNGTTSSAARTFSAVPDAATAGNITIIELTGVVPCTGIVDQVATSTGNGTAISVTAGANTAIANELAILAVGAPNTTTSTQPGGADALVTDTSSANGSMGVTTRILNAVSSPNLTATLGTTRQYSATLITLKTGGVSFVQSVATNGTSGPNNNASLTFNSAPGDALLTRATVGGGTTMSTITDGAGNTYTKAIFQVNGTIETSLWYAKDITGGKVTETLARSSSGSTLGAVLWEFSGLDTVNLLDTTGSTTGTGTTATPTSGVPTAGYVLSIIAAGDSGTGNAWSPTSPFASVQAPTTTNINNGGGISTTFTTTPAAISGSLTSGATTPAYATAIATFKIAGSPAYYKRGIAETSTITSTLGRGAVAFRSAIAETATTSDTMNRQSALMRGLADSSTVVDAAARGAIAFLVSLAETTAATDEFVRSGFLIQRGIAETVGVSEALDRMRAIMRALAESTAVHDSIVRYLHASIDRTGRIVVTMTERDLLTQAIEQQDSIDHTLTPGVDA